MSNIGCVITINPPESIHVCIRLRFVSHLLNSVRAWQSHRIYHNSTAGANWIIMGGPFAFDYNFIDLSQSEV